MRGKNGLKPLSSERGFVFMNDTIVSRTLNNETNYVAKEILKNDTNETIVIMIRNGEVICCKQNSFCVECAYKNQA